MFQSKAKLALFPYCIKLFLLIYGAFLFVFWANSWENFNFHVGSDLNLVVALRTIWTIKIASDVTSITSKSDDKCKPWIIKLKLNEY